MGLNESSHLDLHCLQRYLYWSVGMKGLNCICALRNVTCGQCLLIKAIWSDKDLCLSADRIIARDKWSIQRIFYLIIYLLENMFISLM